MRPAIRIANLSKCYRLGQLGQHHWTLGESLAGRFRRGRANGKANGAPDEIWALKDVSFDVAPGEVVGIIGRNGAGKSTLLKILSRITEPSEGLVELRGRVSSLLEVGTGFHPELTGRENIYLNGSILGMRKAEIDRKFDRIVDFSGVERFLDTPVKRYSSGMQVRLAFAVAAHLEPEILIVDEVLAVGDAEFQRKCLGKMGDVAGSGRTVLFVSHNMAAVEGLCTRAVLLERGQILRDGEASEVVKSYLAELSAIADPRNPQDLSGRLWNERVIVDVELRGRDGEFRSAFKTREDFIISLRAGARPPIPHALIQIIIRDEAETPIFTLRSDAQQERPFAIEEETSLDCKIENTFLSHGSYFLDISLWSFKELVLRSRRALQLEIIGPEVSSVGTLVGRKYGTTVAEASWEFPVASSAQRRMRVG